MAQLRYSERLALSNRKREQKRRKVAAIASLALAGVLMVGGTIAWIIDQTREVENTFQPAEVTCKVTEGFDGATKTNVKVMNTGDVGAYIRAAIVVNWVDAEGNISPKPAESGEYKMTLKTGESDSWTKVGDYYYYERSVQAGGSTDALIEECKALTTREGYSLQVEILSSAIQSEPAAAVQEAWGVTISGGAVSAVSGN